MLTLLRKIRRSLIDSNKGNRYLIYAIGEITLVVIGILIALQINNWNQDRLNGIEESRIIAAVAQEANMFRWQIQRGIRTYNDALASSDRLVSCINDKQQEVSQDTLDFDLRKITSRWLMGLSNETNIYDALSNAGELRLISSNQLQRDLSSLKRDLMLLAKYETYQTEFVDNQLFPLLNQYIDGVNISNIRSRIRESKRFRYKPVSQELNIQQSHFKTSYDELLASKFFSNVLLQHMDNTASLLPIYRRLEVIISNIDEVLINYDPTLIIN